MMSQQNCHHCRTRSQKKEVLSYSYSQYACSKINFGLTRSKLTAIYSFRLFFENHHLRSFVVIHLIATPLLRNIISEPTERVCPFRTKLIASAVNSILFLVCNLLMALLQQSELGSRRATNVLCHTIVTEMFFVRLRHTDATNLRGLSPLLIAPALALIK